jgi:hypothetical protein
MRRTDYDDKESHDDLVNQILFDNTGDMYYRSGEGHEWQAHKKVVNAGAISKVENLIFVTGDSSVTFNGSTPVSIDYPYEWALASTKPTYSYDEITGTKPTYDYSEITGTPAIPQPYAWALSETKPSYDYSEIANTPTIPQPYAWALADTKPEYSYDEITGTPAGGAAIGNATYSEVGLVKIGSGLSVATDGTVSVLGQSSGDSAGDWLLSFIDKYYNKGWEITSRNNDVYRFAYSEEKRIVVTIGNAAAGQTRWSEDGITWTDGTGLTAAELKADDICYSKTHKAFFSLSAAGHLNKSVDGKTWVDVGVTNATGTTREIIYINSWGHFYATSTTGVRKSADGITWSTAITSPQVYAMCYNEEENVLCFFTFTTCLYTRNGETWTTVTTGGVDVYGAAYSPKLGIYAGINATNSASVVYSRDLITWKSFAIPSGTHRGIAWSGLFDKFFIACYTNGSVYKTDFKTIELVTETTPGLSPAIRTIIYIPFLMMLLIGSTGTIGVISSRTE